MSNPSQPLRPTDPDPASDPLAAVDQFKRTPVRIGCLGCTLTGWMALGAGLATVLGLLYLIFRFLFP